MSPGGFGNEQKDERYRVKIQLNPGYIFLSHKKLIL